MTGDSRAPVRDARGNELPPFISQNSLDSAEVVVPLVLSLVSAQSVVDLGCKHGEWLRVFRAYGVTRLLGYDRQRRGIIIEPSEFRLADLTQPLDILESFDLAVCVELAEHLPNSAAKPLVAKLAELAPVVLFSAATPGQGGHGHLNEQPHRYWHDLFAEKGYQAVDCLRKRVSRSPRVATWYRRNVFIYASEAGLRQHSALRTEALTGAASRSFGPGLWARTIAALRGRRASR